MILSTSATNSKKSARIALCYLIVAIFCAIFSTVYEYCSHNVYSPFMVFAFAFPLILGGLPFFILKLLKTENYPSLWVKNLLHSGVATLTVGSIVRGVLDIYGTTNPLSKYYWPLGIGLYLLAVIIWIAQLSFFKKDKH